MDTTCKRIMLETIDTLTLRRTTDKAHLSTVREKGLAEIESYLTGKGLSSVGSTYVAYHNPDASLIEIDIGCTVSTPLPGHGDILPDYIPAGPYVECLFDGPRPDILEAYDKIKKWMRKEHLQPAGPIYEFDLDPPEGKTRILVSLE